MIIQKFDYLSPRITFYHKELISHSSIFSGILSIFFFLIKIIFGVFYSLDLILRKDQKSFYYNTYIEDAPTFPLNNSSLFHYLELETRGRKRINEGIDFTKFSIIGFEIHFDNVFHNPYLLNYVNHWIYGNCDSDDIEGLNYLIDNNFFGKSACIKKYFDSTEKKYYNKGESKFKWPVIAHGSNNPNNQFYSIYIGKCKEDILNLILGEGHHCKNDSEMEEYFKSEGTKVLSFNFVDNNVNIIKYKNPLSKYIYKIESSVYQNEYTINNLNFNPLTIETNNGLIFDNLKQEISYAFQRNDVYIFETQEKDIYCGFCIWLKNTNMFYERTYKRIQDIFSYIGGVNNIINLLAILINRLYNKFITLCDTERLLLSLINLEKINNINIKSIKIKNLSEKDVNNNSKKNREILNLNSMDMKEDINENKSNINLEKSNNFFILNNYNNIPYNIKKKLINDENQNINKVKTNNTKEKKENCFDFILFLLACGKKTNNFKIYDNFRKTIISEECFIKNHLNIHNLMTKKEKEDILEKQSSNKKAYGLI